MKTRLLGLLPLVLLTPTYLMAQVTPIPAPDFIPMLSDTSLAVATKGDQPTVLVTETVTFQANEMRRAFGRIDIASSTSNGIYVETYVVCRGPDNTILAQFGAAQNHEGDDHPAGPSYPVQGELSLYPLLLFQATTAGNYTFQLVAYGWDSGLRAVAKDSEGNSTTWLRVSAPIPPPSVNDGNDTGAFWWQNEDCDAAGDYDPAIGSWCLYLAGASNVQQSYVFDNDPKNDGTPPKVWEAPSDTGFVDASDNLMLTTCHYGTCSCPADDSQSWWSYYVWDIGRDGSIVDTHLELIQLNSAGGVCIVTQTPEQRTWVGNDPHHYMIYHALSSVPVYPECGSRQFQLRISVKYVSGNPIKLDGGRWTHAYAFTSATGSPQAVPNLIGLTESAASDALTRSGYTTLNVSSSLSTAPAGTVIAQNPSTVQICSDVSCQPVPIIEPPGTGINFTVSSGGVIVPNVLGYSQSSATSVIAGLGLVPSVSYYKYCINPGDVIVQGPLSGTLVAPGSTVNLTVDSGTRQTCVLK